MTVKVSSKNSQRKRPRGRQSNAVIGDLESVIDRIQTAKNKSDVEIANNLEAFEEILLAVALGKPEAKSVNKDQIKIIEKFITRAEALLDDYYENKDSVEPPELVEKEDKIKSSAQLISLVAKEG